MASQQNSTFDPDAALRATYTYQLRSSEHDLLARLTETLLEFAREGRYIDDGPAAPMFSHFQAIAADLRFLEGLLRYLFTLEDGASDHLWEARLLVLANQIAPRVGQIAGELEAELQAVAGEARDE